VGRAFRTRFFTPKAGAKRAQTKMRQSLTRLGALKLVCKYNPNLVSLKALIIEKKRNRNIRQQLIIFLFNVEPRLSSRAQSRDSNSEPLLMSPRLRSEGQPKPKTEFSLLLFPHAFSRKFPIFALKFPT
jgi:hypothetical protein